MYDVQVYVTEQRLGATEARRRFRENDFHLIRPGHGAQPDARECLTTNEMATLRRRIQSYLGTCRDRRLKELGMTRKEVS